MMEGMVRVHKITLYIMQPVAFLALLNLPGQNKLKNMKYFLGSGNNVIGTDSRCQIVLPAKYEMPHHIANIRITQNFLTIQALYPHLVYIQANFSRSARDPHADNYFLLATNTQYLPRVGEFFYIGRIKAVISAPPLHELVIMKNVVNAASFQTNIGFPDKEKDIRQAMKEKTEMDAIIDNATLEDDASHNLFEQFAPSARKIDSGKKIVSKNAPQAHIQEEKSHTEVLDQQNYQAEATLILQDGFYAYQPTINLDEPPHQPEPPKPVNYSQQLLLNEIRRREEVPHRDEEVDVSMPDTIVDKENEPEPEEQRPHIEQIESREQPAMEEGQDEMPPTIQEENEHPQRIKPTRTMVNPPQNPIQDVRLYKSGPLPADSSKKSQASSQKPIEDFMDLFGMSGPSASALKQKASEPVRQSNDLQLMQVSAFKFSSLPEKPPSTQKKEGQNQAMRVHFVGFKPTAAHRQFLKKQNLDIVGSPDADYHILLVKQPLRICNRLLLALIQGKRIETEQWIFNKQAEIQSKPNGLPWKAIYEKKGTQGQLLKGRGRFYVSKRLDELLQGVVEAMGGDLTTELVDKKRVINVILRADDSQDTQTYLKHHENKKWRFLKSEAIVDAVLTGKFALEDKYVIKLFDD